MPRGGKFEGPHGLRHSCNFGDKVNGFQGGVNDEDPQVMCLANVANPAKKSHHLLMACARMGAGLGT